MMTANHDGESKMIKNALYHGTSARNLETIVRYGLLPRTKSKVKGNWSHTVQSNPRAVYLTDAYPFHFAYNAGNDDEHGLILELDRAALLPWKLCPDEDMMEQCSRNVEATSENNMAPTNWSMEKRTRHYRKIAPNNPQLADMSLKAMGTAAYYGEISFSSVTRYVIVDWKKLDMAIYFNACDTTVSALNYRILASRHHALVRWFFGDKVNPIDLTTFSGYVSNGETMPDFIKQSLEHIEKAVLNRDGLTVVVCD
jgi:hypothetical protein